MSEARDTPSRPRPTLPLFDSSKIVPLFGFSVKRHKHRPGWVLRLTIFRRFLDIAWFGR